MRPTFKAFLSYSTSDSALVHEVAQQLGRPYCLVDFLEIKPGDDLLKVIRASIDKSALFVVFLSGNSLASIWVNAEQAYADYRLSLGRLGGVCGFIVDNTIAIQDVPDWMQRYRVERATNPRRIAKAIGYAIDDLVRKTQEPIYIGRGSDATRVTSALVSDVGEVSPRALWLYGLPGVGRRTLLRHVVHDVLSFDGIIEIPVRPGDQLADITIVLADELGRLRSSESARELADYLRADCNRAVATAATFVNELCSQSQAPVLIDEGGILEDDAHMKPQWRELLSVCMQDAISYLFFVARRRAMDVTVDPAMPVCNVPPLPVQYVGQILSRRASIREIVIPKSDGTVISEAVKGYLPSINAVLELVASHGAAYVARDSERLKNLRTGAMVHYLNTVRLSAESRRALAILSTVSPLPLPIL